MNEFIKLLASLFAVTVVLTVHEFAHAFVAYKCGDPTAKWNGRMTLNPMKHFDPIGLILFAVAGFGWAKPVPVNPANFKNYKRGSFLTSAAGVAVNYVMAFLFYPLMILVLQMAFKTGITTYGDKFLWYLIQFLYFDALAFCVFNMLPLYPLDGFRMVEALNRRRGKIYTFLRDYGHYILMGLIITSYICERMFDQTGNMIFYYLNVFDLIMDKLTQWFSWPITKFWGLIF